MSRSRKPWSLFLLSAIVLCPCLGAQDLSLDARAATVISLSSRVIDTSLPEPALPEALRAHPADSRDPDGDVVLVKFPGPVTADQDEALRAASLRVYTYLPFYAYLVKMPAGAQTGSLLSAVGASWSGLYHPTYKISREVAAVEPGEQTRGGKEEYRLVMVQVFPDADLSQVLGAMKELGVKGIVGAGQGSFFSRVRLLLTPTEIAALREPLAAIRGVFWIGLEGRRTLSNDTTVWVGQSGLSAGQTTPIFSKGIFGEGQVVAVLDTGIDPDMCYFRDTSFGLPPTNLCNGGITLDSARRKLMAVDFLTATECAGGISGSEWDTQGHGTHVAGTVAGDNFASPLLHDTADGMAPGARLVIQDGGFQTDNCGDLPGIGCPVVDLKPLFQQAYDQGARLHTNSWGDNENAAVQNNYTAGSQDVDEFMWNHKDFLIFFAAGNSGPGTASVSSPSTAKSGVSVGATLRSTSANSMASFSSCGPTADGRIKPEVTVPGSSIVSARNDGSATSNNCGTTSLSGTSMATPGAAGLTALIRQYFTDGWYPTGSKVAANGFTPSAALLKATLVSSAINMTGTTAIPANCQGWGRVLLEDALFFTGQPRKLWVKDNAAPFAAGTGGSDRTFSFVVTAGEPFKATLAWTDFPSTPAASPNLNNDLDLIVTGPTGTVWRGNVFAGGVSTTGGAADRRNTLEQVLLAAPAAGTYTVTVRSFNVPSGPQPFALVVTGNAVEGGPPPPPPVSLYFDDFESTTDWTVNPTGADKASSGVWEQGDPEGTDSGGPKQLDATVSGLNALVTGRLAGAAAGDNDVDGGTTSIQSPPITLPATGTVTLSFSYYFAHGSDSSPADFLRVRVVGRKFTTTLLQEQGSALNVDARWGTVSFDLSFFLSQTVRILIDAVDAGPPSLIEAAVDDVRIVQQP
jgi:subtilisin family serine protease